MLRFLLCFLIFHTIPIFGYSCNGTAPINAPQDLSKPTYFPSDWSEGETVPHLDADQHCLITVNIPNGYYANVTFYKESKILDEYKESTYVVYSNNKISQVTHSDRNPYIFITPAFRVGILSANLTSNTRFAFKIQWTKVPNLTKNILNIIKDEPPKTVIPNEFFNVFVANPNNYVSLSMFSLVDPNQNDLLRQSAVFAGDTFGTNFVGTLETITSSGYSLTTPFNRLSVYTFGLNNIFNYPLFMGQDLQNLRKYSEFRGANCPESGYCKITWDGIYFDEMVVTSYSGTETITTFAEVFDKDTCVNVYENRDSNSTWIAQLKSDNYLQQLPLKVNGNLKFYQYFGQRKMTMYVTRDGST